MATRGGRHRQPLGRGQTVAHRQYVCGGPDGLPKASRPWINDRAVLRRELGRLRLPTMKQTMEPEEFSIREDTRDGCHTLILSGELDLASAPVLEAATARLCSDGASEIVLDLGQLDFIDSTGLRTILGSMHLCEEHLCNFWLIPGKRTTQRLFELAGLLERLPFRESERPPRSSQTST